MMASLVTMKADDATTYVNGPVSHPLKTPDAKAEAAIKPEKRRKGRPRKNPTDSSAAATLAPEVRKMLLSDFLYAGEGP